MQPESLLALMGWCKENGLRPEADLCAFQALAIDPLQDRARAHLGIARPRPPARDPMQ